MFSVVQWRLCRLLPVGALNNSTLWSQTARLDAFRQGLKKMGLKEIGLKEIGFNEGRNITINRRAKCVAIKLCGLASRF